MSNIDRRGAWHDVKYLPSESYDAGRRVRVGQLTTLFDGKALNADNPRLWSTVGTADFTFAGNIPTITADAGEYGIRESRFISPYFSGKSQQVEMTAANFHAETKVVKRLGYFNSDQDVNMAYSEHYDGFYVEASGGTHYFVVVNDGTEVVRIAKENWAGDQDIIKRIDFSKFNVFLFDFLWLGGANLRLHCLVPGIGFVQMHSYQHAGVGAHTIFKTPNHSVRYEIRSEVGAATTHLDCVCSQVSTEGSISERGEALGFFDQTGVSCATAGTIYALMGIKKGSSYRDNLVRIKKIGVVTDASSKMGRLILLLNPTLSAPLSYSNVSKCQVAYATNQTVTAGTGRALMMTPVAGASAVDSVVDNILTDVLSGLASDDYDELVLAYVPNASNQTAYGGITVLEYS